MKRLAWASGLLCLLATGSLLAQEPDVARIRASMVENQQALRQYVWHSRARVEVDGEQQKVDLYQMRYNFAGELESTRLGGEAPEQKKVRGPVRKRLAKNKKKGAAQFTQAVKDQLQVYLSIDKLTEVLEGAFLRPGEDTIMLRSQDMVIEGDMVEFELVRATRQPMTMRIESTVDDEPVEMTITFQRLPEGPNYPARQVVETQLGKRALVITTENYNYMKQPR
ncbi:MAG: hypothetical protein AAGA68_07115 [Pseudomonadota bacterium]